MKTLLLPNDYQQTVLDQLQVRLTKPTEQNRFDRLLDQHHYLGRVRPVGERLYYVVTDARGQWLAVLSFSAAAKHLKHRDRWIGWTPQQQRRRLKLVANNSRFLVLPDKAVPNLASKALRLVLDRLSDDWQARYGHPILAVETFVDPAQFCGTVYTANGWIELGQTDGWGRTRRDYYVKHGKPKRLFVRELCSNACRSLQAEHLKGDLAMIEAKTPPACTYRAKEIRSMTEHFKQVPEYRSRVGLYPHWALLTIVLLAVLCEAPRGPTDLEKFARGFGQGQRRALGIRRNRKGRCPAPDKSTFCRLLKRVDGLNKASIHRCIERLVPAPKADFPPSTSDGDRGADGGNQQGPT